MAYPQALIYRVKNDDIEHRTHSHAAKKEQIRPELSRKRHIMS